MATTSCYVRRLVAMLFLAMPAAVVLLAVVELAGGAGRGAFDVVGGAAVLVYFWGAITGATVSLAHTLVARRVRAGVGFSVALGTVLGLIGGALTPTFFTGLLEPAAIALGGFTGFAYGGMVTFMRARSDSATA